MPDLNFLVIGSLLWDLLVLVNGTADEKRLLYPKVKKTHENAIKLILSKVTLNRPYQLLLSLTCSVAKKETGKGQTNLDGATPNGWTKRPL